MYILLLLFQVIQAIPIDKAVYEPGVLYLPNRAIALDDGYRLSIQGVFAGIFMITSGLLLAFRGYWDLTKGGYHTQKMTGFVTMSFVTWLMLTNFEPITTYGIHRQTIYLVVPIVVGLVVIVCMPVTLQLYLMLIGGLGGLGLGLWMLGWKDRLTIETVYGKSILLTVLVLVFMITSLCHHFFHVFGAAVAGSYLFFMGLDVYFHTGFLYCITTALDANPNHAHEYKTTRGVYIMQSCMIISFIVAFVIQGINNIKNQHAAMVNRVNPMFKFPSFPQYPLGPMFSRFRGAPPPVIPTTVIPPPPPPTTVIPNTLPPA